MRFVKASERLPKKDGSYCIKNTATGHMRGIWYRTIGKSMLRTRKDDWEWLDESLPADDMTTTFQNEPVNFLLSNALRHLTQDQQRQLCNALQERLPVPASIEDEAERLYSDDPRGETRGADYKINDIKSAQRSAHITCARQYMGEIEKLTDQNHKLMAENDTLSEELGELKEIQQGIEKLKAENSKMRMALKLARLALQTSYDVTEYPANGETSQDSAIKIIDEAIATSALK